MDDYNRLLRNLKRRISRAESRGFEFDLPERLQEVLEGNIEMDVDYMREISKRLSGDRLYQFASKTMGDSTVEGKEALKIERSEASKKGWQTRRENLSHIPDDEIDPQSAAEKVKENIEETLKPYIDFATFNKIVSMFQSWPDPERMANWSEAMWELKKDDKERAEDIFESACIGGNLEAVAKRCEENSMVVISLLDNILYGSGGGGKNFVTGREQVNFDLTYFASIIRGHDLTEAEKMFYDFIDNELTLDEDS